MANKEIKQTIRLAGEKEYSAAIREAQRNLRTLRSELKAETAELGANATAQQKNEARAKSLKAQIEQQEKVVETLKKALAEAKKDYGDNEDVVQKWEQKLNEARTTLANMQNGLADAENAMRGVSGATAEGVTATKSFADALASISSVGESVSGAIESIFTGLISTVRDVVVDLWDMIGEIAAKANNWTDIAGFWNTDPANVEKWARSIEASGNSFADYETIVSRLALGGKEKKLAEMLGISDVNYKSQWDYAVACMDQIARMTEDGSLPDNFWEEIFGEKKATKAMDVINDWATIQEGLTTFDADNDGFGMGKDALETMNDLWVQLNTIEQKWIAIKDQVAAGLGTIAADLLVNVSGSLDALNEFMNADTQEEREAALEKLRKNIEEFFTKVAEAIRAGLEVVNEIGKELSESDDPIVSAIGTLMIQLTEALQWVVDNQDKVKIALAAIFGVWLISKLGIISAKLAGIVAQIAVIKTFKAFSFGEKAAETAAGNGVGAAAGNGVGAAAAGGSALGGLAGLGLIVGGFAWAREQRVNNPDIRGSEGAIEKASGDDDRLQRAFVYYVEANKAVQDSIDAGIIEGDEVEKLIAQLDEAQKALEALPGHEDILKAYSDWRQENSYGNMDWVLPDGLIDEIEARYPGFFERGGDNEFRDAAHSVNDRLDQLDTQLTGGSGAFNVLSDAATNTLKGLPGLLRAALFNQIGGLKVYMDGEVVGRLVTPYVGGGMYRMVTE